MTRKEECFVEGPVINIDPLISNYTNLTKLMDEDDSKRMYFSIKQIFEIIYQSESNTGVVSPIEILNTLKKTNAMFQEGMHQDAEEFMSYLLNSVNEYCASEKETNFVMDNFQRKVQEYNKVSDL